MLVTHIMITAAAILSAPNQDSDRTAAAGSLDGRPECVAFRWEDDGQGNSRAAISIPVKLNGRDLRFQFDTGADTNILYGTTSDAAGWSAPGEGHFRPKSFTVGEASFDRPYTHLLRDMPAEGIDGTLGLQALIGRVTVIDYPGQRLCLFKEADLPRAIGAAATFVSGALHDGKFFVPAQSGQQSWRDVLFDTGSSALPLTVDLDRWTAVTNLASTDKAPRTIQGMSWGKPVGFAGAPLAAPLRIGGKIDLGRVDAYTKSGAATGMQNRPFALDGILGNAPLSNGMVVLILTGRADFGYIAMPSPPGK